MFMTLIIEIEFSDRGTTRAKPLTSWACFATFFDLTTLSGSGDLPLKNSANDN
jgi:hypothetical protein